MNLKSLAFAALLTGGLAAALPSPATAQYPGQEGRTGPDPALQEAQRQLKEAKAGVSKVRGDMSKIKTRFASRYEGKSEWEDAQKAYKKAEAEYNAANKKALQKLQNSKEYKALKEKQAKADAQVTELQDKPKVDKKVLDKALQDRTDAAIAVRKMETALVKDDATLTAAKEKLDDAKKTWEALQEEMDEAVKQDPEYQALEAELEAAQANVEQVEMGIKQQQMAAREARRAAQESERQSRSSGRSGRRSGGGGYGGY
jgi:chromosome segregation ATPase